MQTTLPLPWRCASLWSCGCSKPDVEGSVSTDGLLPGEGTSASIPSALLPFRACTYDFVCFWFNPYPPRYLQLEREWWLLPLVLQNIITRQGEGEPFHQKFIGHQTAIHSPAPRPDTHHYTRPIHCLLDIIDTLTSSLPYDSSRRVDNNPIFFYADMILSICNGIFFYANEGDLLCCEMWRDD